MVRLGSLVERCLMMDRSNLMVHWLLVMYACSLMVYNWGFMMLYCGGGVMRHCMVQDWGFQVSILVMHCRGRMVHWCFMVRSGHGRVMGHGSFMMCSGCCMVNRSLVMHWC